MKPREIKFRVWNKEAEKMKVNMFLHYDGFVFDEYGNSWELKDCVLMRFTGLKDCNGKEIYEGDIVFSKRYKSNKKNHIVKFICCGFEPITSYPYSEEWEIIGNVYKNPELLNNKQTK